MFSIHDIKIWLFQGFDDNISSLPDNITREEGWFEGRDTNEILVR